MIEFVAWLILGLDTIGAIALLYILLASETTAMRHRLIRWAYVLGIIGLIGQAYHQILAIDAGLFIGIESMWWLAKDLSLLCFSGYYVIKLYQRSQSGRVKPTTI